MNATTGSKANFSVDEGEQGVILAHAHIVTRVELGSTLTHQNVAGDHTLAAKLFDSTVLGI